MMACLSSVLQRFLGGCHLKCTHVVVRQGLASCSITIGTVNQALDGGGLAA
jgi:hypothetical protein